MKKINFEHNFIGKTSEKNFMGTFLLDEESLEWKEIGEELPIIYEIENAEDFQKIKTIFYPLIGVRKEPLVKQKIGDIITVPKGEIEVVFKIENDEVFYVPDLKSIINSISKESVSKIEYCFSYAGDHITPKKMYGSMEPDINNYGSTLTQVLKTGKKVSDF